MTGRHKGASCEMNCVSIESRGKNDLLVLVGTPSRTPKYSEFRQVFASSGTAAGAVIKLLAHSQKFLSLFISDSAFIIRTPFPALLNLFPFVINLFSFVQHRTPSPGLR